MNLAPSGPETPCATAAIRGALGDRRLARGLARPDVCVELRVGRTLRGCPRLVPFLADRVLGGAAWVPNVFGERGDAVSTGRPPGCLAE